LFLATFDYIIISKPGKYNKADGLSRRPDYKEGIASKNAKHVLLTPEKFLLNPKQFKIWALHVIIQALQIFLSPLPQPYPHQHPYLLSYQHQ
jgi:hypothetical protein